MRSPSEAADVGLPLPRRVVAREENDRIRERLRALEPGQSLFLPCPEGTTPAAWQTRIAVVANRLLGSGRVATAQREEHGTRGVRVWRRERADA